MFYILVLISSIATGAQIGMLRSTDPLPSAESCAEYVDHVVKEGKLLAAVTEQASEPVKIDLKCVHVDKDA